MRFNARSGANGQNARGTVKLSFAGQTRTDNVVCLRVIGTSATIGVVRDDNSTLLYRVDNAPEEPAGWGTGAAANPPDCATGSFQGIPHTQSSFVLHDEP